MSTDDEIRELARAAGDRDLESARRLVALLERERDLPVLDAGMEKVLADLAAFEQGRGDPLTWVSGANDVKSGVLARACGSDLASAASRIWLHPVHWDVMPPHGGVLLASVIRIMTEIDELSTWIRRDEKAVVDLLQVQRDLCLTSAGRSSGGLSDAEESLLIAKASLGLAGRYSAALEGAALAFGREKSAYYGKRNVSCGRDDDGVTFVLCHYMDLPDAKSLHEIALAAKQVTGRRLKHFVAVDPSWMQAPVLDAGVRHQLGICPRVVLEVGA